jgi:hypothetical protein
MDFFALSGLINGTVATIFGIFGYFKNRRSFIHRIFGLMNGAIAIWGYSYFLWIIAKDETTAFFWVRLLSFGATLIPVLFLHWILALLGLNKKKRRILVFGYLITFILVLFSFTPLYVKSVEPELSFQYWPKPGILYHFYIIFVYLGLLGYGCYQLLASYRKSYGYLKQQIRYVLLGIVVGLIGGFTNFPLWYGIEIPPYGNILVTAYVIIFAYAILKYRLMDIRVAIKRSTVFSGLVIVMTTAYVLAALLMFWQLF